MNKRSHACEEWLTEFSGGLRAVVGTLTLLGVCMTGTGRASDMPAPVITCRESAWMSTNGVEESNDFQGWGVALSWCVDALRDYPADPVALASSGRALYKLERFNEAVAPIAQSALAGHAYGQFAKGVLYEHGYGIQEDVQEAVKWYRLAAEQGFAPAQYRIWLSYEYGFDKGVFLEPSEGLMSLRNL